MIKRILHLLMMIFLISYALQAQAQIALPEQVCVGTVHHYWVEGLPGSTYTWKVNGVIQDATTDNIDIQWNELGSFTLEVQEHQLTCNGDVQSAQVNVTDQIIPEFTVLNEYCTGSLIAALPTTSNNGIIGIWAPAIDNTQTTIYTFTPEANQCATPVDLTITITDGITPIFEAVGAICSGSPVISLPTTSQNNITGSWSPEFNNAATTEYTFTPDDGQCATPTTLTVVVDDQITPTFEPMAAVCRGSSFNLPEASIEGITGTWNPAINNTTTTTYIFTPDASYLCATTATLTITISDEITPTFAQAGPYCAGFAIPDLPTTSDNGITGTWSPAIDNTQTTTYTFTPDPGQCGIITTMTITISDEITPTFAQAGPYCAGFAIPDLPTTSDNGITGTWSPAIDNTQTTTYTFTPDNGQCETITTMTITISDEITPTFAQAGPYCAGFYIPDLPTISDNGITGSWSPAIDNTQTATYIFTPDPGQCGTITTLTIVINNETTPVFDPVGPYNSGAIIADLPTTSNNGITGTWSPSINNQQTTTYIFTPDVNQCAVQTTLTIEINGEIIPLFDPIGPLCSGTAITLPNTSINGITGSWSPAIDNTQTTEYTFTPDAGQGAVTATLIIEITNGIIPLFDPIGPLCSGTVFSLPNTSTNGITGSWSPAIDNTQTTTYTFAPDAEQCATTTTLTVSISDEITPVFAAVGPYCTGMTIADLPVTSTNGITGSWWPAINNTQTTEYTFTPDAGQCGVPATLTIEITDEIQPTFDPIGPLCAGSVIVLPQRSNNGISGTWTPAINNTTTTTYTFTPDPGQCAVTTNLTIEITNAIIPLFESAGPYCPGDAIAELPVVSNNGIRGSWSPAINNTQSETYTFTPEEGQCASPTLLSVVIEPTVIPTFDPVGPYCPGTAIPALPDVSNNGIHGSWSPAIDNTQTNTYTFRADEGLCPATATLTIVIDQNATPLFNPVGPFCPGADIAALPTVSTNGIAGTWSPAIDNTQTTSYTFTPDAGQCGSSTTLTIAITDQINPTFDAMAPVCSGTHFTLPVTSKEGIAGTWSPVIDNTQTATYTFTPDGGACAAMATLTVEVLDSTTPEFSLVGPFCPGADIADLPGVSNNNIHGSWSPAINNMVTTTYTFIPEDGQCADITTLTIEIGESIIPTFEPAGTYCRGASIASLPTVSNEGIRGSWSPEINNQQTTTYTFTPDEGQCAATASMTIMVDANIVPVFDALAPVCSGDMIQLPNVSNNGITGLWNPAINNTQTTTYTFTPNEGQCATTASLTVEVRESSLPTFNPVGPYCVGSTIADLPTVSTNGIRGLWSPAINNQQTTTYTFTPYNNQCVTRGSLTIVIDQSIEPTFDPVGPYSYNSIIPPLPAISNNGIRGTWRPAINNRQTTTYTFTPNSGQCAVSTTLTIDINDQVIPTFDPVGPYCSGSTIAALPAVSNNGIRGTWAPAINNSRTTTYTFTPDAGQSAGTAILTVVINDQVLPTFETVGPYCAGALIEALPFTSINGIRGTWSPAINNTQTTTYTFTPDQGQCAKATTMTITIEPAITPVFNASGPYCSGAVIAALPATSNNGIRGTWSPAINNTQTTTYTFTPNAGECAEPVTTTIEVSDQILPTFDPVGPFCPGAVIADLPTVSNNGIRGRWRPAINNRQTTTYTFTPDAGQCGTTTTMTIAIDENVTPTFDPVGPYCAGSVIDALPLVSNNGISGTWSPAINNTRTTTYTFTPGQGQCGTTTTLTIVITNPIIPAFNGVGPYCLGSVIAELPTVSNNGITGSWSPAINNQQTTTYTFTPDAGQCAATATLRIVINQRNVPTFDPVASYCQGSAIAALKTVSNNGIRGSWRPAINNTRTTTYTFTPDAGQCGEPITMTIEITDEVEPTFNPVGPYPRGAAIAALQNVSNNGIRGAWRPAINNQQTTTYTFTPDAGQCSRPVRMTIAITDDIIPVFDPVGAFCAGSVITPLPVVSNNGIRGSWSPAINNQQTTTYTFTPDMGQSAAIVTMTITISEKTIPTFDPMGPYCPGTQIAALPVVSNNGIRGSWSPAIDNRQTTIYTFTPDAGQCAATATMTINIAEELLPIFDPVWPSCPGSDIAALPIVSNNGIRGTWSPAINNVVTTTYTFTPDAGQCALSTTLTIEIGTDIVPDFDLVGPFCPGTPIESLPVVSKNGIRGRWSPVMNNMVTTNYLFTPLDGQCAVSTSLTCEIGSEVTPVFTQEGPFCIGSAIADLSTTSTNGVTGTWSPAINNQQTTTYTFTPTPGRCALPTTMTIAILQETEPSFAPVPAYCVGADIADLPTTSLNNITGSWSPAIDNTQTTTYTFTPDANQCATTAKMTIAITEETVPTFVSMDSYCEGSDLPALPVISTNAIKGTWSPAINNHQTTTYTFTPDQGQCATSTTIVIAIDQKVTPTFTPVASYCPGSVIAALPLVSNNGIHGAWSPAINNRQTTTYTFTPDASECANSATLTIEIKESIVPVFTQPDLYCVGAVIADLPQTSTNGITGTWSPNINNLQTTTYTFTPDAGQCATTTMLTILINPEPVAPVAKVIPPDCITPTGTIEVVSPRGSQYQYRLDGGSYQSDALFNGLDPLSTHTVQVKDVLTGCESKITSATINSLPQPPSVPIALILVNPKCNGSGVIQVTEPTGADYEYRIDKGAYQSMAVFTNVTRGEHLIIVRNKINGCESLATRVFIPDVPNDMDFDGIADNIDLDVDGDGILNSNEGGPTTDTDGDGHMNYMDIDADGDGIVDIVEAQNWADFILPSYSDKDNDGQDDAYDKDQGGTEIIPVDTDKDGIADFMDLDSDNDLVPDFIEGHDVDSNGKPDHYALNSDKDNDGLDDGYDTIPNICGAINNVMGSNAPTQDFDGDGIPDWRDENDDDDEYLTRYEDLNGDGDYSNDDIDFDGYPEYLDYGRDCDLFIPDAFSPNGDNVHDLYMIYCINHYPDATIYIFDQLGNKIYEKRHYGNLEFWKTPSASWWDGKPTRGPGYSRNNLVPPGTYYYVLDLGNGQVKKSYVFVSY
ncbi:MAG TPA: gliding motility-associated C-terminal domain-containing protein [Prolixibacteraceae bacterium]|nr:gliding motility-associated C-terminal domain-containing protein [Prolixibacteraceae bacterium]